MKTKIIVSVIVVVTVLILRSGLSPWTLEDMRGGFLVERQVTEHHTPEGKVIGLVRSDSAFKQLNGGGDFGLFRLALIQQTKGDKAGVPMWFIQLPFTKWKPIN